MAVNVATYNQASSDLTHTVFLVPLSALAGDHDDLRSYDPIAGTWTLISDDGDIARPPARSGHGFTSAGNKLYVHGGVNSDGVWGAWGCVCKRPVTWTVPA